MSKHTAPFHFDIVGSFLRPAELKEAREAFNKGNITREELTAVEDRLITDLIQKQKAAGLPVITDGEFRRAYWHLDFMWGFNGVKEIELEHGYKFVGQETAPGSLALTGKITGTNHPFVEHFKFVKQFEDENTTARQTIPAPSQFLAELFREDNGITTRSFYPDLEELIQDIAAAYRQVIKDLYDAGCRNIQFDDCTWGMCCDHAYWTGRQENVDAYYLEFDDDRSGGFEPLREVSPNKKVVLGLITSKRPELEDKEIIKERIKEATKYIPLERLCLSPQCGFASCEIGNQLTEEEQWAKLALVKEIAHEVWGD
ncbi:MAG: 5-methyltetrahydropteroyltriglutamate--homocysteine methyltransferase [Veillonella sp.]|nr:5-methyltetrahydropteroyltriglutamate--homocysteine methyltransferase [Veillonella sp.]